MAITLNLFCNGAVGFIDWLDEWRSIGAGVFLPIDLRELSKFGDIIIVGIIVLAGGVPEIKCQHSGHQLTNLGIAMTKGKEAIIMRLHRERVRTVKLLVQRAQHGLSPCFRRAIFAGAHDDSSNETELSHRWRRRALFYSQLIISQPSIFLVQRPAVGSIDWLGLGRMVRDCLC